MLKKVWLTAAIAGLASCGDNNGNNNPDAPPVTPDSREPDAAVPFELPAPFAVSISETGPDQLQSATAGPGGTFYAAGYAATTPTGPRMVRVAKLTPAGLDVDFGTNGVATTAVEFRGGADEIDVATQPGGKIIVSATVANATDPNDRDIALIRLNANGTLDTTFGDNGVRVHDLNSAISNGTTLVGLDAARGLAIDATGRIYVHAAQRGIGNNGAGNPRTDTDFTVVRFTANGALDTAWGASGKFLLDIQESNATARGLHVFADGSVIAGGYANSPGVGSVQAVLFKLTPAGVLDTAWGEGGVFHDIVLAVQTEIYHFAVHGPKLVTGGYGRNTGTTNDYISMRFDIATGDRDLEWGGAPNGAVLFDPSGAMLGSNCRNAIALPDGRTALIGSTGPGNMPSQDAVLAILDADGRIETERFGDGIHVFPLGSNGNDQLWGGAVSGDHALFVGYKGGGATQTEQSNDDSYAVVLPLN